ncbi:MAG: lipid-A-disaccharide synthase [Deltaproteobacteria bacterium RBG_13_61_14]|nr:MAG: lipid-A-disaccharide synthase [Deltaproteobacteria bacterium RBG_13_61_14]
MPKGPKVLVVAGEASADRHAASLVEQWRRLDPGLDVYGVGGYHLRQAGARLLLDFSQVGVVGILEVIPNLRRFYQAYCQLLASLETERPDLILLLDLPDFNLFFAGRAKARHPEIPILYYISPQVWAWRKGRVKKIKRVINQMLVLFPFEKDFYRRHGVEVEFVGHPLQDQAQASASQEELRRRFEVASASPVVALLPGSRAEELRLYLPVLKGAVSRLLARHPQIAFLVAAAPTVQSETIAAQLSPESLPLKIIEGATYDVLAAADLALVASGTATLETALLQVPMVILGKVSWPNYLLARPWVSVPFYGMPNLLSGREIVPELTMWDCTAERVAAEAEAILMDRLRREAIRQDLARVRDLLGPAGASARAAGAVHAFLQGRRLL